MAERKMVFYIAYIFRYDSVFILIVYFYASVTIDNISTTSRYIDCIRCIITLNFIYSFC